MPNYAEGTMLTIDLPEETERKLAEKAARTGKPVELVARELIENGINGQRTLDEILAPFRADVAASGLTDDELDRLFDEARNEVQAARSEKAN